jgi:hypothetical protein
MPVACYDSFALRNEAGRWRNCRRSPASKGAGFEGMKEIRGRRGIFCRDRQGRNHAAGRRYRKAGAAFHENLGIRLAVQRRRFRRPVFILFGLFDGLIRWDDPIKTAFGHSAEDKLGLL